MNYDGAQSESDGVVIYREGSTHKDLVENVRIIIDDSDFAKGIDIDEAMNIMNSYYFSFHLKEFSDGKWLMVNDFEAYGGINKGRVDDYEKWKFEFYE